MAANTWPVFSLAVQFDKGPFDDDPGASTLTTLDNGTTTRRLLKANIAYGRTSDSDQVTGPGGATLTLKNDDRLFDPFNTAGTLYGKLLPRRQVRLHATRSGTTYPLFQGWTEEWPQEMTTGRTAEVEIPCVDAVGVLARGTLPGSVWEAEMARYQGTGDLLAWYRLGEKSGSRMFDSSGNRRHGVYMNNPLPDGAVDGLVAGDADGAMHFNPRNEWGRASYPILAANTFNSRPPLKDRYYEFIWSGAVRPDSIVADFRLISYGNGAGGDGVGSVCWDDTRGLAFIDCAHVEYAVASGIYSGYAGRDGFHHIIVADTNTTPITPRMWINGVPVTLAATGRTSPTDYVQRAVNGLRISDVIAGISEDAKASHIIDEVCVYTDITNAAHATADAAAAAHYAALVSPWEGDTTKQRLNRILEAAKLTSLQGPTTMSATHTASLLAAATLSPSPVDCVQAIEASEAGRLYTYMDTTNGPTLRLLERNESETTATPLVFTDATNGSTTLHYESIKVDTGIDAVRNKITVNCPDNGDNDKASVTVSDATSRATYGEFSHEVDTLLSSTDAQHLAEYLLDRMKDPHYRITEMVLNPAADARLWDAVLGTKIGDRIQVTVTPQSTGSAVTFDCLVDGISHDIDDGTAHWETTFFLSATWTGAGYWVPASTLVGAAAFRPYL